MQHCKVFCRLFTSLRQIEYHCCQKIHDGFLHTVGKCWLWKCAVHVESYASYDVLHAWSFFLIITLCWLYITSIGTEFKWFSTSCSLLFICWQKVGAIYFYRCDFIEFHNCLSGREKEKKNEKQSCYILGRLSCGWNLHDCELFISAYMCVAEVRSPHSYAVSEQENKKMCCRHRTELQLTR